VQVRERDIEIDLLPAPFDAVHCPYVDDTEALLRAVATRVDGAARDDDLEDTLRGVVGAATSLTA
jgi:hypothetical protein